MLGIPNRHGSGYMHHVAHNEIVDCVVENLRRFQEQRLIYFQKTLLSKRDKEPSVYSFILSNQPVIKRNERDFGEKCKTLAGRFGTQITLFIPSIL